MIHNSTDASARSDGSPSRAMVAQAVAAVLAGRSLDDALPGNATPFVKALTYGVLRHLRKLDALIQPKLQRPLIWGSAIHTLILCGIYQLRDMDVADHAAISETVSACELVDQPRAKGLVNALLRSYQREAAALEAQLSDAAAIRESYPDWLTNILHNDWKQRFDEVLANGNQPGPMTLRLNARKAPLADTQAALLAAGHSGHVVEGLPESWVLDTAVDVYALPGFAEGAMSVQDASAQIAAHLLELAPGQRVLDACSAPGGKTAHILERETVSLTAVDTDPTRLAKVRQTLTRLGLEAHLALADAADVKRWWDGQAFDRILIDAPCSGTGVIRRHPDIKWLRRSTDLPPLALTQRRLLDRLWPLLAPGGLLVYATCSIFHAEGDDIIRAFLERQPDAKLTAIPMTTGQATRCGLRIAPGGNFDGFYYARLRKSPKSAPQA